MAFALEDLYEAVIIKIETYWNVNMLPQLVFLPLLLIKIETYWNVN